MSRVAPGWRGSFAPKVTAIEIEPGPTVSGRGSGYNACPGTTTLVYGRLCLDHSPYCSGIAQPVASTIGPPQPRWLNRMLEAAYVSAPRAAMEENREGN